VSRGQSTHVGNGASNSQGPLASNPNWELELHPQQDAWKIAQ
jgi:hypothetical protein